MSTKELKDMSIEERKSLSDNLMKKHTGKVPIIVSTYRTRNTEEFLKKHKYMASKDLTMRQLAFQIRRYITDISQHDALFYFVSNTPIGMEQSIWDLYNEHKNDDGFLYITCSKEETFGYKSHGNDKNVYDYRHKFWYINERL